VPTSISVDPPALSVEVRPWPLRLFTARGLLRPGRFHVALLVVALAAGALSLLYPSTPSYDPWSWIIWGREILHGQLNTTNGPSWKPMPVIFTTVFSLFGKAAPNLWLIVARGGAFGTLIMSFRLAARLTWWLRERAASNGGRGLIDALPALGAGLIAIVGVAGSASFGINSILGYSEGVMIFSVLVALERHLDGHPRQAFAIAIVAALDRPETWIFWGPYGLWLMWRDPGARAMVIGLAVLVLLLWFVPQKLGGGSFTSGVSRAQQPRANSAAYKSCPFCTELSKVAWPQVELQIKIAAALVIVAATGILGRAAARGRLRGERERAMLVAALLASFGYVWWLIVAVETQAGFSGNTRYLVLGSAALWIAGSVGFGWAAMALAQLLGRLVQALRGSVAVRLGSTAALGLVVLLVPGWFGDHIVSVSGAHRAMRYQSRLRVDLERVITAAGGPAAVRDCAGIGAHGSSGQENAIIAEAFQVPMVAWYLNLRIDQVGTPPGQLSKGGSAPKRLAHPPRVVFQDSATGGSTIFPRPSMISGWEARGAHYARLSSTTFHVYEDCRK
jgi:hypothetical protein